MSRHSDTALVFNAKRDALREKRATLGVKCPACIEREPKRDATILLPGQRCYCGYRDPRKRNDQ